MKRLLCGVLSFVLLLTAVFSFDTGTVQAASASTDMRIYSIFLGTGDSDQVAGDAVLVESGGEYLLMDFGRYQGLVDYVIPFLQKMGVTELSLYISHMHIDHYGGADSSLTAGLDALHAVTGMKLKNLYLPDSSIGAKDADYVAKYDKFVAKFNSYTDKTGSVVRLKAGSTFAFGNVSAEVLGPLGTDSTVAAMGGKERYQNNMSLVTMLTCGKTKYLTTGDIMREQEELLVKKYKNKLDADILKGGHHGLADTSTENFIAAVTPSFSFLCNTGYQEVTSKISRKSYAAVSNLRQYGMYYLMGEEGKNVIYDVSNDSIAVYQDTVSDATRYVGKVTVKGSSGFKNDTTDSFYLGADGLPQKGFLEINKKTYWYNAYLIRGYYDGTSGKWLSTLPEGNSFRYIANTKTGEIKAGVYKANGVSYMVDSKGVPVTTVMTGAWTFKKSGGYTYAYNKQGLAAHDSLLKKGSNFYWFDSSSHMAVNKLVKIKGSITYYFDKKGCAVKDKIVKVGSNSYYLAADYQMAVKQIVQVKKYKYYFDKKGRMVKNKTVKVNGVTYKIDKKGHAVEKKK